MTNYSLRARMMILILAPTVLIGLLLSIFFVVHRYNDLQRQLEDAGASIIEPLAVSTEYGMSLQNRESIGQLISVLHRRHSDIVRAISVYDENNRLFVTSNFHLDPSSMQLGSNVPFPRQLTVTRDGDIMILRTPIISESYSPDESPSSDAKNSQNMLGYIALELDLKSVRLQQYKEIFISSVMMLFCIGIALIFGWRLMRDVTGPIRNMVNTVDRIRRGQLDSRVEGFMLGELDMLKNGINSMAMSLAAYHEEMQHNIDQATSDLRETLEQMEIQNVELDLAKKRAQEAARIKSEFLANMSHELRTPLNGVIGFTRLTLKTELTPTQRDHLNTIERSANNLLAIINDVLDFSKLEAGKLILESIPFPLRSTLDEVVTLLAHSSHDKGLELTLNIKSDVPDNVIGDPLRLQQIITNLVGNAIKFTENGNIDILVEKRALSNTKVQIEVQIRDTGIGIPERDQSRLFQAFRQADASISRRHGGTGLGLVITQKLVNEMGGDISFHSQPNRGSTFWFHINLDLNPNIITGIPRRLFPRLVEAGEQIGTLQNSAAAMLGLPVGIPVISAGHDTQFALFGAGADQNEPVLSSGTWEILMVRSAQVDTSLLSQYAGSTCELDSQAGLYNPGMQWLASGVLEWVRKLFWTAETPWQMLIEEARLIAPGADGVKMQCDLLSCQNAGWQGVTLNTTRGHFYRAALEGLTAQLQRNLQMLEKIGHFKASELLLVGGGSRNTLWNQIKANMLDIPVKVLDDAETTVAGAALFGWYGVGEFNSPEEARAQIHYQYRYFYPQTEPEFIEEV